MEENDFTELAISGIGIAPYSSRNLTQTLNVIGFATKLERTVNGELIDLSIPAMRKYESRISATDMNIPAVGGLWPGMTVVVDCVQELSYPTGSPDLQERTAVSGSARTVGEYTFYRPQLTMKVRAINTSIQEYAASVPWSIDLEEV